jgi:hypothetical protein
MTGAINRADSINVRRDQSIAPRHQDAPDAQAGDRWIDREILAP